MYRTGDLGRWRPDGTIEFLGRNDHQVKIRGFRIEPGEIEAALHSHSEVREAVVLAREDAPGDKRLVAYVVGEAAPEALRAHLGSRLPEYMVPAAYVALQALPLTPNGKLDRKALPAPDADAFSQRAYEAAQGELEATLASIWSELLGVDRIGRSDDFFALGGHSLLAVRVASKVRQALKRTLPLREIFARRTVRELAAYLEELAPTAVLPAIEPVPRDRPLPLAPVQERLWVVHQLQGMQASYNMPLALQLQGPLSMPALQAAFDALLQRHETLRTRFVADADGQARQEIEPARSLPIPVQQARREEVPALAQAHAQQVFDLGRAPLLNVQVLQQGEQEHVLLLNMHHIISDGWSMNVLAHDMQQLYAAQLQGVPAALHALGVQYADHAHWLRQQDMAPHAAYWAQTLHGYEPGLTLPWDRPAEPRPSVARTLTLNYPADLCAALGTWCSQHGATLFMALTAALGVVLQRYTGRRDLCVGTTVAGRDRAELEPLIGFFINIVALRLDLSGDPSASELLQRVKDMSLQAFEHQTLPFEQVLQQLKVSGDSAQELVPVMVRHQNVPDTVGSQWGDGLTVELLPGSEQSAKCPLDVQFFGDAQGLRATVDYAADLFDEATVRRLLQHHQQVLQHMVQQPRQPLSAITVLTAEERQLVGQCNRTARELDDALCLVARFEQQVQATPEACACLDEQRQLSYAELNARANRIAHALRERGVGPEVRVGLYMPRSCDFIAAMLGIFKAGGVYVPFDTNAPPAYLQRLIDDAQPQVLMHGAQPPEAACAGIEMLSVAEASSQGPESNLSVPWQAQQLMMLAYTSGSTGQPKGVLVPQGQILNLLQSMQARLPLDADDVVVQKTMAPFVVSMKELWGALLAGVPQVVVSDALLKDPPRFIAALQRGKVTRLFIVPSHLQAVLDGLDDPAALSHLRVCVTAGEPLTQQLRERVQRTLPWVALWNNFGCTELNDTTYCDPEHLGGAGQFVPIGWPIDNVQVHVLDERLRELPLGVVGELCVHYPWMARGYWRQPELTAERFVPYPYGEPGSRVYRTGDMVRRLADGALEYLGREDFDIKIRGQRVDVRQVEAALAGCEGVQRAAAGGWSDDRGDTRLVAYVVTRAGQPLQAARLRQELAAQLPAFMVPVLYVALEALPRTNTGKLDRKSLPAPHADALAQQPYTPPQTDTERALAAIWSRFLELPVDRIGRDDDFFALGGHSLLATRIAAQVQQALQRPLQLQDVFAHATLRELAAHVDALAASALPPPIEPRGHQGDVELSFAQQRLWFLHRWDAQSSAYHNILAVKVNERLDEALVERTLEALVRRHEALRTCFPDIEGHAVQRVAEHAQVPVECIDLSDLDEARREAEARQASQAAATRPFDLAHGPVLRLQLVRLGAQGSLLTLVVHHIVADGWSMDLLIKELLTLYGAFSRQQPDPFPPLAIQYPDYAVWQRRYLQGEVLQRQQRYWSGQLADAPVLLALPTDRPRPAMQSFRGRRLHRRIEGELAARLRAYSQAQQVTPFMVLLSAFNVLLWRHSGQTDIVLGTPVANRHHPGLEGLIGMLANTLALRSRVEPGQSFADLLAQARQTTLEAQAHQDLPFEHLVELLQVPRSTSHSPLFQVMFSLLSLTAQRQEENGDGAGLDWEDADIAHQASKFDLTLSVEESPQGYAASWQFNSDLFDTTTIQRMAGHFEQLLRHALAEPQRQLARLQLLDATERDEIVQRFNDTATDYPRHRTIHELFEEQAARTPQAAAVVLDTGAMSYAELDMRANRLAHHLIAIGVRPDSRVAISLPRGADLVVALLATLKAGGGYVPLDPNHPTERLAFMLTDSAPRALLTHSCLLQAFGPLPPSLAVLELDARARFWDAQPMPSPAPRVQGLTPFHLAYVIYTSGSTGTPKGVANTIGGLVNRLHWFIRDVLDHKPVTAFKTSIGFVDSVTEMLQTLLAGGTLVAIDHDTARDLQRLAQHIVEQRVNMLVLVPSLLRSLAATQPEVLDSLRTLVCSGERLTPELGLSIVQAHPQLRLYNLYGSSEVNGEATFMRYTERALEQRQGSLIGRPIANTCVYVLDSERTPVPQGAVGELYVGGEALARGYLNQPDLTAERFVPDPFGAPGARLYRTGDLGRWAGEDGQIEFLGRSDFQVKIRGHRVEVGEIETKLLEHPKVREAVVLAREDEPGDLRLVAYFVGEQVQAESLRAHLAVLLPEYMVPAAYVPLDALPLTPNGKLDRRALPAPEADALAQPAYAAPQTETERALAALWSELLALPVERIGRDANFFALGGHSLLAIRFAERMRKAAMQIDVRELFARPTLRQLAQAVSSEADVEVPPNGIPQGCEAITPNMLTLIQLTPEQIAQVVSAVEGGAANVQDIYPLGPLQESLLVQHLMREEGGDFLSRIVLGFESRLELDAFVQALQTIVERHDILRTAVLWDGLPEPVQVVWRRAALTVEDAVLSAPRTGLHPARPPRGTRKLGAARGFLEGADHGDIEAQLEARYGLHNHWMDLRKAPLIRAVAAHDAAAAGWKLVIDLHLLIGDAESFKTLAREIEAVLQGQADTLPRALPYRNYIAQTRLRVSREEHEAFFRQMLSHVDEPTAPFGVLNLREERAHSRITNDRLPDELTSRLGQQARVHGVSVATIFHLAWARLLSAVSGREEVVFGTVMFGRMQGGAGADQIAGNLINIVPVAMTITEEGVARGVRGTQAVLAQLLHHEHAPLTLARRCSGVRPAELLFSSLLNFRHGGAPQAGESRGPEVLQSDERSYYPFSLDVDYVGSEIFLTARISAKLDSRRVLSYVRAVLSQLVDALENAPETPLTSLDILPAEERHLVIEEWNGTAVPLPAVHWVQQLFEAHVRANPQQVAVEHDGQQLSYGELNRLANRLAHDLRMQGVGPDTPVAMCIDRSIEMIVGLLAILKAGGAFVPLDPSFPPSRLSYIVDDSRPVLMLFAPSTAALARSLRNDVPILNIKEDASRWDTAPDGNLDAAAVSGSLAYVIYTSGSTGKPKGVMIEHRALVNYTTAAATLFGVRSGDWVLQQNSVAFDLSLEEILPALITGASLQLSATPMLAGASAGKANIVHLTAAHWHTLVSDWDRDVARARAQLQDVHTINVTGDALSPQSLAQWEALCPPGTMLVNTYGPTETTVSCTAALLGDAGRSSQPTHPRVTIGRPLPNVRIYILAKGRPVPVGVPGDLHIAGVQVARGYLNRPDLTAERFVPDPFSPAPGARMYKSGDLACWREDGTIDFLGRNDHQVKVRGFRIELGEVEAALQRCAGVREAVVLAREEQAGQGQPSHKRLVAYVVADEEVTSEALHSQLTPLLPEYMLPAAYVHLDALPLTPGGKLDRQALPAPGGFSFVSRTYEAPQGQLEEVLAQLWAQLLGLERVGRHDSFFDLGGHSLLALQVMSRLSRRLEREVPVHLLFANPTVAALARRIGDVDTAEEFSNLVAIRTSGSGAPLFIIHAGDGEVGYAFDLAPHLPDQHPLYALAAIGFAEGETPLSSVEAMAASYLRAIRSVQPHGPYHLIGWSAGGTIAYEIAAQLPAAGEPVRFVGVIDTLSDYSSILGSRAEGPTKAQFLEMYVREEFGHELADRLTAYVEQDDTDGMFDLCQRHNAIGATIARATLHRHLAVRHAIALSLGRYRPQPTGVSLVVFTAADEDRPDPRLGWDELAEHGLDVVELPGTHWSIVEPAHIRALGRAILQALAAQAPGGD
jgi:amino acid adenylation domain-containing protein